MKKIILISTLAVMLMASCNKKQNYDATGTFEATEILVTSEASGRILSFDVTEGATVRKDQLLGAIDSVQLSLQRDQLKMQQQALLKGKPNMEKQVASLRQQISKQETELKRIESLMRDDAATQKQYDDAASQLSITRAQLDATLSSLSSNAASIDDNAAAIELQILQLDDRIAKCRITSPIDGTVLVKYMEAGEMAVQGRPLMKVADLDQMYLRAYFTSTQLAKIKVGQKVTVIADFGGKDQVEYPGTITWIAQESEFTPKSIQTNDSRANLVYAAKIAVKNDGKLKIGLYGEVRL